MKKPDDAFCRIAIQETNPGDVLFIDDKDVNLDAFRKLGAKVFKYVFNSNSPEQNAQYNVQVEALLQP